MDKDTCYKRIMNRIETIFTPTEQERERIARRLPQAGEDTDNLLSFSEDVLPALPLRT